MGNTRKNRGPLLAIATVLLALYATVQGGTRDHWNKVYSSGKGIAQDLAPDQLLLQLFGFREFLAGILWVRADGFFDEGNYDGVLPIINVCTILDPKQIDIFSTGMWHIAYNFTDEDQRSDRRYIASALALGKEGSKQNPATYEIFFETGWIWYHKIDDEYNQSVKWFELAHQRSDIQSGRKNLLSNALQRNLQVDQALELYYELLADAEKNVEKYPNDYSARQMRDTVENNLDTMLVRMVQRGWIASKEGRSLAGYDTQPPFDVGFGARVTIEEPFVLNVIGSYKVAPVGTRIRIVLRDAEGPLMDTAAMKWDSKTKVGFDEDREVTFMQDQLFIKNQRFKKRIDMSRDRTMYPFSSKMKNYVLEFYYNPRSAPPHIQDKFGFNGEGFTDKNYLRTDIRKNFVNKWGPKNSRGWTEMPELVASGGSQPVLYCSIPVSRDMIFRRGDWETKVPVLQTKGFDPASVTRVGDDTIQVPTLRGQ